MNNTIKQHISILLTDDNPEKRLEAAEGLAATKDPAANIALVAALGDKSKGVQDAAMRALIEIGGGDVARIMASLIGNDDIAMRNLAAKVLISIGEPAVRYLIPYLRDSSKDVRKFAVDILGRIGSEEPLFELFPLLKDSDPNVRNATVEALGLIGSEDATLPLCDAFIRDPSIMSCTADALGRIGDTRALVHLRESLSKRLNEATPDPLAISQIIEALGKIGDMETLAELRRHVRDTQGELRLILLDAVIRIAVRYGEPLLLDDSVRRDLFHGLESDDDNIRMNCVKGLSTFQGAEVTWSLICALEKDDALETLLVDHLTSRPDTFILCVEFLEKPSSKNRSRIIRLLGKIAWNCVNLFYHNMDFYVNSDLLQRAFETVRGEWETSDEETKESIVDTLFLIDGRRAVSALSEFVEDSDSWLLPRVIDQLTKIEIAGRSSLQ